MSTQRALLATKIGEPLTLTTSHPVPKPGPNQVLVKVTVAGTNPHDAKARDTGLFIEGKLPAVLTNDVVGTVHTLGPNVTQYSPGDRIAYQAGPFSPDWGSNGLQEYAIADVPYSMKIPDAVSDDQAASLPTNIIAPLVALFDHSALGLPAPWTDAAASFDWKGTTLLVIGGGSNCGKFGIQLARMAGVGKIVVVGGKEDELKGFGATHVLDRHGGDEVVLERIRAVVGDDLVYAYDAVNPPEGQVLGLNALSSHKKGALARLLPIGPVDESKVKGKSAGFEVKDTFGMSHPKHDTTAPFWEKLPGYLLSGEIQPLPFVVEEGLDAGKVNSVLDAYTTGKPVTKTHFHF